MMRKNISNANRSRENRQYPSDKWYDEFDYDGFDYGYWSRYGSERYDIDIHDAIDPLIRQIKTYDEYRQRFERKGGTIKDLATLSIILSKEIFLDGYFGKTMVQLTDPNKVKSELYHIDYDLHLQVRELPSGMPCYYLCRTKSVYFSDYNSLIIEDLYCSPGYPMPDKRFVRLMKGGKEKSFLRLSPFRKIIKKEIQNEDVRDASMDREADKILYNLGRYVLGPAWHEDQFPGMLAAEHFELTMFPRVIELLYLDLSGELCELRSRIDGEMLEFFETMYSHPAILGFLKKLKILNGAELNELPKEGLRYYVKLQKAFSHFLQIEIPWGKGKTKMPLNMLLLGNFSRLHWVGKSLNQIKAAAPAKKQLEKEAENITRMLIQKNQNKEE
jgi:hypothetical protein